MNEPTRMKRYRFTHAVADMEGKIPLERSFVRYDDLQAWALKLNATVKRMRHERMCLAHTSVPADSLTMKWIIDDSLCNCPRGQVLRLIGEVL